MLKEKINIKLKEFIDDESINPEYLINLIYNFHTSQICYYFYEKLHFKKASFYCIV